MYKRICVTNRHLVTGDFFEQIGHVINMKDSPDMLILREKDLTKEDYLELARKVKELVFEMGNPPNGKESHNKTCLYLHNNIEAAKVLGIRNIHLSFGEFMKIKDLEIIRPFFDSIGTSVHSLEDIRLCNEAGFDYVFAGHIFETDCKKGLKGRGLDFLREIVTEAKMPVYAIGGIKTSNEKLCIEAGAAGVCMMSAYMTL
ncbi:thiamine phosphate synthase [Lachnospira pectinoschiza]|uniref:Thiamine-phosphate pyrophosphorylase n=1 Tax=Lachnospira pectinoschiza TaxID=28052 RepID=A0A1G9UBF1_9FIRM|nr:thiamine phosphate synthase [Lachnospira pectinoschiza]SDM56855.1 thiamine-phosphate pyrophosphorylase [Lachnospira pectinoschiza]